MGVLDELKKYEVVDKITSINLDTLSEIREITTNLILIFAAVGTGFTTIYYLLNPNKQKKD